MILAGTRLPIELKNAILENPEWILNDSELMNSLIAVGNKSCSNKVIDLRDYALSQIKSDLKNLSAAHISAISAAYENYLSASNLHQCIIEILDQETLPSLLESLSKQIKPILQVSRIELCINADASINLNHPNLKHVKKFEMLDFLKLVKLTKTKLVVLSSTPLYTWNTGGSKSRDNKICSEAFLSLRTYLGSKYQAVLCLGAENREKFNGDNETDYLQILAKVLSHQLHHLLLKRNIE